jgi:hypothetical protein
LTVPAASAFTNNAAWLDTPRISAVNEPIGTHPINDNDSATAHNLFANMNVRMDVTCGATQ